MIAEPFHDTAGRAAAIVVAAGRAERMGGDTDKTFLPLAGKPLVLHSLLAFDRAPDIAAIVLVVRADRLESARRLVDASGIATDVIVVAGGPRRQDSVRAGLDALPRAGFDVVLVHDGARPLIDGGTIAEAVRAARQHGAAVAAVPVVDTIKRVNADGLVVETPPRGELWAVQTPQAFRLDVLCRAHDADGSDVTDDAALVERLGHPVHVFGGSRRNIKVTTPDDLIVAAALLESATEQKSDA